MTNAQVGAPQNRRIIRAPQARAMLWRILEGDRFDEQAAWALSWHVETQVWQRLFAKAHDHLSNAETTALRERLGNAVHWALHIGRNARILSGQAGDIPADRMRDALEDMCLEPFIMFDTEDSGLYLLLSSYEWFCKAPSIKIDLQQALAAMPGIPPDAPPMSRVDGYDCCPADIEAYLQHVATTYVDILEKLVVAPIRGRADDVWFLCICYLALQMSACSVLLLWRHL